MLSEKFNYIHELDKLTKLSVHASLYNKYGTVMISVIML